MTSKTKCGVYFRIFYFSRRTFHPVHFWRWWCGGMGIAGTVSCYQNQFAGSENKMLEEERMEDWLSLSPISVLYFWVCNLLLLLLLLLLLCHFIVQCSGRLLCFSKMRYKQEQRIKTQQKCFFFHHLLDIYLDRRSSVHTMFVGWLSWPSCNLCSCSRGDHLVSVPAPWLGIYLSFQALLGCKCWISRGAAQKCWGFHLK